MPAVPPGGGRLTHREIDAQRAPPLCAAVLAYFRNHGANVMGQGSANRARVTRPGTTKRTRQSTREGKATALARQRAQPSEGAQPQAVAPTSMQPPIMGQSAQPIIVQPVRVYPLTAGEAAAIALGGAVAVLLPLLAFVLWLLAK